MAADEWIATLREFLLLGVTAWGVSVAARGLNTWKDQLKGSAEWELGRRYLRSVYELRDALELVRSRLITGAEIDSARKTLGVANDETASVNTEGMMAAYHVRWRRVVDAGTSLQAALLEAEVFWGNEAKDSVTDLQGLVVRLGDDLEALLMSLQTGQTLRGSSPELADRNVFSSRDADGEFAARINSAVRAAEDFIRPKLKH